jgi:prepilin-type processing-associated H-X9-DG protein
MGPGVFAHSGGANVAWLGDAQGIAEPQLHDELGSIMDSQGKPLEP